MASKKKGLSVEEKRTRMLELFYESKQCFQLKELEKIAPKQKGVISQSVKEITQSLVDDGLVECEKIGTFVCYWSFPSKALQMRKRKLEDINKKVSDYEEKVKQARLDLEEAKSGKEETEERSLLLKSVADLRAKHASLSEKLAVFAEFDPSVIKEVVARTDKLKEDVNRWTDNIFAVTKWCKAKFGVDTKTISKMFEIPEDLDYVE